MSIFLPTFAVLFGVLSIAVVLQTVKGVKRSDAYTWWHAFLDSARGSASILLVKVSMFLSSLVGAVVYLADFLNFPGVEEWVKSVTSPKVLPLISLAFLVVAWFARMRTL